MKTTVNGQQKIDGSARLALYVNPSFNEFCFIEKDSKHIKALEALKSQSSKKINIFNGDANVELKQICEQYDWKSTRAVLFLDPFGCEVKWETLDAVAKTHAMDVWYLFPYSSLYRESPRDANALSSDKANTLNRILGTEAWKSVFYQNRQQFDLYDKTQSQERLIEHPEMLNFMSDRLKTIFLGGVAEPKIFYRKDKQIPMQALYFAVSNPSTKAYKIALSIANHILKKQLNSYRLPINWIPIPNSTLEFSTIFFFIAFDAIHTPHTPLLE